GKPVFADCRRTFEDCNLMHTCKSQTISYFFFQAEDGIRDRTVTGVQTCALPISAYQVNGTFTQAGTITKVTGYAFVETIPGVTRSEERRVGKECRYRVAARH